MRIEFNEHTGVSEVTKFNVGVKPRYAKKGSTMQGCVWCSCTCCVGSLLLFKNKTVVVGWFDTECKHCGTKIDWSTAEQNL